MSAVDVRTIGYPRIGVQRTLKKSLEAFWKDKETVEQLQAASDAVFNEALTDQINAKVDVVGVGGHSLYDHILDWTIRLGLLPQRFVDLQEAQAKASDDAAAKQLKLYFAMARGVTGVTALDMTKWFDTNYHNLTPEIDRAVLDAALERSNWSSYLDQLKAAIKATGDASKVSAEVHGPFTLVERSKLTGVQYADVVRGLVPIYIKLFKDIKALGVAEVQLHESAFVLDEYQTAEYKDLANEIFAEFAKADIPPVNLVSYFDDLGAAYEWVVKLPGLSAVSLDFTRGDNLALVEKHGFPDNLRLGAGVVDGRSVWSDELTAPVVLAKLKSLVKGPIAIQSSSSLLHVPVDFEKESVAIERLKAAGYNGIPLRFARQKLADLRFYADKFGSIEGLAEEAAAKAAAANEGSQEPDEKDLKRDLEFVDRRKLQLTELKDTLFPTSSIGSFPQTKVMRRHRFRFRKGLLSKEAYEKEVDAYIAYSIGVQEGLGLDVLVHGEPERSDMVEYFAEKMDGYLFTSNGWVQSYGSRYVRAPIIFGDVTRRDVPMTVREFKVAQDLTVKPVKGMLTGPTTILNWSFPRKDISRRAQAYQIARALRDEVHDLEEAGCRIVQVDEPALREGLPLRASRRKEYLRWAVNAFRLATTVASPAMHVVTHFCYSEFGEIVDAMKQLDADQITIENSRSDDEMLKEFVSYGLGSDFAPGAYDVHSPVVPSVETFVAYIEGLTKTTLPLERFWIVPDCGLKTRNWDEVTPALRNLVQASKIVRESLAKNGASSL